MKNRVKMNRSELMEYIQFKHRGSVVPNKKNSSYRKRKHKSKIED